MRIKALSIRSPAKADMQCSTVSTETLPDLQRRPPGSPARRWSPARESAPAGSTIRPLEDDAVADGAGRISTWANSPPSSRPRPSMCHRAASVCCFWCFERPTGIGLGQSHVHGLTRSARSGRRASPRGRSRTEPCSGRPPILPANRVAYALRPSDATSPGFQVRRVPEPSSGQARRRCITPDLAPIGHHRPTWMRRPCRRWPPMQHSVAEHSPSRRGR